ncbi:MAG: GNAT family N-acetyltransferase [Chloroflexota bacterium]
MSVVELPLSEGLVLRSVSAGYAADRVNLAEFYMRIFGINDDDAQSLGLWTEDLLSDEHPTTTDDDIWVVVDTAHESRIVSALLLIPQTWRYEDVPFGVGRVELVATDPDYRRRGLIRSLMQQAHKRSESLGHLVQGITGIPHYYRQFGYSMAVELGTRSLLPLSAIPPQKDGEQPRFTLRPAEDTDISNLIAWDIYHADQVLLSMIRTEQEWGFELNQRQPASGPYIRVFIIQQDDGPDAGYVALLYSRYFDVVRCVGYAVGEESSYLATYLDVIRGIKEIAENAEQDKRITHLQFSADLSETLDTLVRTTPMGVLLPFSYAWYIRIPDTGAFIRHIAPVLERRLAGSGANRYTGELKIAFYDLTGVIIRFENGRIVDAQQETLNYEQAHAALPFHMFHNLVMGHRDLNEIRNVLPDAFANREARVLLEILFPKKRSGFYALA